jgi:hemolysin III
MTPRVSGNEDMKKAEEVANTWTHLLALIGAIGVSGPLIRLAADRGALAVVGTVLFIAGMLLMFTSSTLYHAIQSPVHKARLRVFDHVSIYVMIAGSYSLLCMFVVGGWKGWSLFVFMWLCVLAGTVGKCCALGRYPRLSLMLYLLMGWAALLIMRPMWLQLPHAAFWWILAEGLLYTVGTYFFRGDETHRYWHAVWHVFIVLGALCHTIATWLILTNG